MTIRRRIKHKWHFTVGDFDLKKASYNPNGSKEFEVWYKKSLIGVCRTNRFRNNENDISSENILEFESKIGVIIGRIFFKGVKKEFPEIITKVEIFPIQIGMVLKRLVILEKWPPFKGYLSKGHRTILLALAFIQQKEM